VGKPSGSGRRKDGSVDRLGASFTVGEGELMELRYGMNPHQRPAFVEPVHSDPLRVISGQPSYINLLDALNSWQLVREADALLGRPAATSFKHVSPAGAATSGGIDDVTAETYGVRRPGELTAAYLRARDADPRSSYGDFVAVSRAVDDELAELLTGVVSDGIIAPDFAPGTVATLAAKKRGQFLVLQADPAFIPPQRESREVYGMRLTQPRDDQPIDAELPADVAFGMIVLRYTQSNSVVYVQNGATLGIGAGQQSRIDCTKLAGAKVDTWWQRRSPTVREIRLTGRRQDRVNQQIDAAEKQPHDWLSTLDGVTFVSDGALPFRDNVDEAARHGVRVIAEPGGSIRSPDVEQACADHGITLLDTGARLFHH
jgi:phosphoribosylaminoimidazolecarboxamide formyltransferase/IMP cyclohydrolase